MKSPVVSIIVPLFNKRRYVVECLRSIALQTLREIEVIVVDDCSTDGGSPLAESFCANDERFTFVNHENRYRGSQMDHENRYRGSSRGSQGPSSALNVGLSRAKGEYVARVDADDWIEPDMYATLVMAAKESSASHARAGYWRELENGLAHKVLQIQNTRLPDSTPREQEKGSSPGLETPSADYYVVSGIWCYKKLFDEIFVPLMNTWSGIYRRECIMQAGICYPPELTNMEDIAFNAQFYALNEPVALLTKCLYHYRELPGSLSAAKPRTVLDQLKVLDEIMDQRIFTRENAENAASEHELNLKAAYTHYRRHVRAVNLLDSSTFGLARKVRGFFQRRSTIST